MSKLLELAERCEKAEGPNYPLEREIALAIGRAIPSGFQAQYDGLRVPNYTASIDAAMSLVPEEYGRALSLETKVERDLEDDCCIAELTYRGSKRHIDPATRSASATLALAICATALKARASQEDQSKAVGA